MGPIDAEVSSTTNPTRNLLEQREPSTEVGPSPPPSSGPDSAVPHNLNDKVYGFDTGGVAAYVVPDVIPVEKDSGLKIVDAFDVVPEYQIIEKGKKKKRLFLLGGIFLLVVVMLIVVAVVVLTLKKRSNADTNFATDNDRNSMNAPSQAPSTSLTTATTTNTISFDKVLSIIESHYDGTEQFDAIFSDESSPQYRAATWVANNVSTDGNIGSDDRVIRRFALATFYFATNGDEWFICGRESTSCDVSREWLTGANECDWYAIKCNQDDSHITEIFFDGNGGKPRNIRGTLPYELSFLSKLAVFILPRGPISGTFPDWSKLSTLQQLLLNENQFEGSFPTYLLRQNPLIRTISFNSNNFQGQLLQDLSSIDSTALTDFSVNRNNLSGPILSQIGKLSSLRTLNIGENGFTGTLPEELYTLTNLTSLDLRYTNLCGKISPDIGALSRLINFIAGNTEMSGTLPEQLFSLGELQTLDLSFGNFTGSLSESFSNLTNLDVALLYNNGFDGTIPSGFERLPFLQNLQLHANDLSGSVSEELCNRRGEGFKDIQVLTVDCLGDAPEVSCTCCTNCPQGL